MKLVFKIKLSNTIFLTLFLVGLIFTACTKEKVVTDIDFQRQLIGGTGSFENTKKNWRLDSLAIDGKAFALTTNQKKYIKTFSYTGAYSDSDGFSGSWEVAQLNELKQTSTSTTGTKIINKYEITEINSTQLKVKLSGTTTKYEYFFVISN